MRKVTALGIVLGIAMVVSMGLAFAAEEAAAGDAQAAAASQKGMYAIAAALAVGLAAAGAGFAIGHTGAAALGAISEKPEMMTWGLIIVALAEGIALYGLIISFMLLTRI
ncbi:MAG: ATPase [Euryarchaeota archaeon]|nr:ATPase [Euryarchaeota archaeon]